MFYLQFINCRGEIDVFPHINQMMPVICPPTNPKLLHFILDSMFAGNEWFEHPTFGFGDHGSTN